MNRLTLVIVALSASFVTAALEGGARASSEDALLEKHVTSLREIVTGPPGAARPRVLLLGTFHFDNPGRDAHKPKYTFDLFGEKGQLELGEVLVRLAEFAPTKILVESPSEDQGRVDRWYASYRDGKAQKTANEIVTVGFALGKRLGHERVHAFDAEGEWLPTAPDTDEVLRQEAERMGQLALLEDPLMASYARVAAEEDEILETLTLRQRLRLMNHPALLSTSHGAYFFFAHFRLSDGESFPGPDGFASSWHNRNLRMFANIQRLASEPDDRLLVIVGAGHVPILQHCVQSCPTMVHVPAYEFLAPR